MLPLLSCLLHLAVCELFAMEMERCCSVGCTASAIDVILTTHFSLLASQVTYGQFVISKGSALFWNITQR
jgi:hypothetical protein